jgi:uncharacterized protein YdhG (YjbR/CyaY superfamily)
MLVWESMKSTGFKSVDLYIAAQPEPAQRVLQQVRQIIRKAVPRAEEVISYQMPTFALEGHAVLHLAGWKQHYSLYPASDGVIATFAEALAPYDVNDKGTMRFPLSQKVPATLIARIAKLRAKEVAAKVKTKAKAPATKRS